LGVRVRATCRRGATRGGGRRRARRRPATGSAAPATPRAITNGSFVKLCPPPASGAGAARRVNLLILLKPPQTAAQRPNFGRRPQMHYFTSHTAHFCGSLATNAAAPFLKQTHSPGSASSDRPTPTASSRSARRLLLRTQRPRPSQATSSVHQRLPPMHCTAI